MHKRSKKGASHNTGPGFGGPVHPYESLLRLMQTSLRDTAHWLKSWSSAPHPEALHQARVAWRRFKGLRRFYRPMLPKPPQAHRAVLQDLWRCSGALRNLDVALGSSLPVWRQKHPDIAPQEWPALIRLLQSQRRTTRRHLHQAMAQAEAQAGWRAWRRWLQQAHCAKTCSPKDWQVWTGQRLRKLHQKIKHGRKASKPEPQHACRILMKQERYVLEGLAPRELDHTLRRRLKRLRQGQRKLGQDQDQRATLALIEQSGQFPILTRAWRASL
jgi:CHAD domain-containing protein